VLDTTIFKWLLSNKLQNTSSCTFDGFSIFVYNITT
jgi:hypothetical protein